MNYQDLIDEDVRYYICKILSQDKGYSVNSVILHASLNRMHHNVSHDQLANHLHWLEEQGLVRLEMLETLTVAILTNRGMDAVAGNTTIKGVRKPLPSETK